jgi:hypothetical protein
MSWQTKYLTPDGHFVDEPGPDRQPINIQSLRQTFFPNMNEYEVANADRLAPMVFETMNVLNGGLVPVKDDKGEITLPSRVQMLLRDRMNVVIENSKTYQKMHQLYDEIDKLKDKLRATEAQLEKEARRGAEWEAENARLNRKLKTVQNSESVARQKLKRAEAKR